MPEISVVLPVYNGEKYLKEAVDSIRNQTFKDWELIIVDDCSIDNTLKLAQEYQNIDDRIKVYHNKKNKKLPGSLNEGFKFAQGNYLTWTSDDNIYEENAFEIMYNFMINNDCGLVYCDMSIIDENNNAIGYHRKEKASLYFNNCIGACFLYKKDIIKKVGEYNENLFLVEDYEYWLRISEKYDIDRIPRILYKYRTHSKSLTSTRLKDIKKILYKMRIENLDFILSRIEYTYKIKLFVEMFLYKKDNGLIEKFWKDGKMPDEVKWIMNEYKIDESKKYIIFGAGEYGRKAAEMVGNENVQAFIDNNSEKVGTFVDGIEIQSFDYLKSNYQNYNVILGVGGNVVCDIANQLVNAGIDNFITYLQMIDYSSPCIISAENDIDISKKTVIFGSGEFGEKALDYIGKENVFCFIDNNAEKVGTYLNEKKIESFDYLKENFHKYNIVIAVSGRYIEAISNQLRENGIYNYTTYLKMVNNKKNVKKDGKYIDWIASVKRAENWIINNTIKNQGICNPVYNNLSYPEVSGYYIPTLIRWGYRNLAKQYADWLLNIQNLDGSWNDTEGDKPYIFDTAQIIKGLIAQRNISYGNTKKLDLAIIKGCEWIISNMNEEGRLVAPDQSIWGDEKTCSELIHIYCISPLLEAGKIYNRKDILNAAKKMINYYVTYKREEILDFSLLSHFYAYVMEGLCDVGEYELAKQAMKKIELLQSDDGAVPGYKNVKWVCSTGLFQLAIVWYKLGNIEKGNRALEYATKLQNKSGGWYGSYGNYEKMDGRNKEYFPTYFPISEISWAVKYFLDAIYYKNVAEFNNISSIFDTHINLKDGRYEKIEEVIKNSNAKVVCDVGCGTGRYINELVEKNIVDQGYAVDISDKVMLNVNETVEKKQGTLTYIPYEDEKFDITYAVESLEHAILIENAIKEMVRVTKKGGKVIIIDKPISAIGMLEIDDMEQWISDDSVRKVAKELYCKLDIVENIQYEDDRQDGLFRAWILSK